MISLGERIIAGTCVALLAGSALLGQQAQFQGSVPTGVASPTPVSLTLRDAIDRGLRTNLGLLSVDRRVKPRAVSGCGP